MRKLWAVLKREYLERVRSGWFLAATVFGPLLMAGLLFLPSWFSRGKSAQSAEVERVLVMDATGLGIGKAIVDDLVGGISGNPDRGTLLEISPDSLASAEKRATEAVVARQYIGYLVVIPPTKGRTPSVRYAGRNATSIFATERLRETASRNIIIHQITNAGVDAEEAGRIARTQVRFSTDRITAEGGRGGSGSVSILFAISVGILLYMTILMYGQNVLRGVIDEKQTRVAEMVVSSMRAEFLLGGKVLGIGAVGLTQIVIWMTTSFAMVKYRGAVLGLFGIEPRPLTLPPVSVSMAALLVIYFLLGYTLYAALFAAVGAMVSSEQEAQQAQIPVIMLLVVSITFLQPVLNAPDSNLAITMAYIPFSAPVVMPLRMSAVSVPSWEVALSLISLLSASYLAVYVSARIYRTGILMHGKRATLKEIVRWVRQGG